VDVGHAIRRGLFIGASNAGRLLLDKAADFIRACLSI
jgi:hypothetical protein